MTKSLALILLAGTMSSAAQASTMTYDCRGLDDRTKETVVSQISVERSLFNPGPWLRQTFTKNADGIGLPTRSYPAYAYADQQGDLDMTSSGFTGDRLTVSRGVLSGESSVDFKTNGILGSTFSGNCVRTK